MRARAEGCRYFTHYWYITWEDIDKVLTERERERDVPITGSEEKVKKLTKSLESLPVLPSSQIISSRAIVPFCD